MGEPGGESSWDAPAMLLASVMLSTESIIDECGSRSSRSVCELFKPGGVACGASVACGVVITLTSFMSP